MIFAAPQSLFAQVAWEIRLKKNPEPGLSAASRRSSLKDDMPPSCGSTDVALGRANKLSGILGLPKIYVFKRCGYSGAFLPENEISDIYGIKSQAESQQKK